MENKRKFPRIHESVNIKWEKKGKPVKDSSKCSDITSDVSEGGARLIVYEKMNVGEPLSLELQLPSGRRVCSEAKVAWIKDFEILGPKGQTGYEIGVQFINISESDKEELKQYFSWCV
jgi:c-di-GMP-binding flagellar brake protein YcgR